MKDNIDVFKYEKKIKTSELYKFSILYRDLFSNRYIEKIAEIMRKYGEYRAIELVDNREFKSLYFGLSARMYEDFSYLTPYGIEWERIDDWYSLPGDNILVFSMEWKESFPNKLAIYADIPIFGNEVRLTGDFVYGARKYLQGETIYE